MSQCTEAVTNLSQKNNGEQNVEVFQGYLSQNSDVTVCWGADREIESVEWVTYM